MITQITVENFCSIKERSTISLTASKAISTDNSFVELKCLPAQRVSVLAGIFGANASGKTNFLKSFSFLYNFMLRSYEDSEDSSYVPVDRFVGSKGSSKFEIEIVSNKHAYHYAVELTPKEVIQETIKKYNPKSGSFRTILKRKQGVHGPLISHEAEFGDLTAVRKLLKARPLSSVLSTGLLINEREFSYIQEALGKYKTNVNRRGKKELSRNALMASILKFSKELAEDPEMTEEVERLLKAADLGVSGFRLGVIEILSPDEEKSSEEPFPYLRHESDGGGFEFPITRESSGTQRFFSLLQSLLMVLKNGGVAIIDEMESDLHPHLIELILDLFQDSDNNPLQAQLIFTCHHVEVLNQLSKEQIIFVEKNDDCESNVYSLSSVKGVRRDDNYFGNYNAGRYGAIPEPSLF